MNIEQVAKKLAQNLYQLNDGLNSKYPNSKYNLEITPILTDENGVPLSPNGEIKDFSIRIKQEDKSIGYISSIQLNYFKFEETPSFEHEFSPIVISFKQDFTLEKEISLKQNPSEFQAALFSHIETIINNNEHKLKAKSNIKSTIEMFRDNVMEKKFNDYNHFEKEQTEYFQERDSNGLVVRKIRRT